MRSKEEVALVQTLAEEGLNNSEIARRTGISRTTIRDWRAGRHLRATRPSGERCADCGHASHKVDQLPQWEYVYLLGVYLGDGCISTSHKGVHVLRIVQDARYAGLVHEFANAIRALMPSNAVNFVSKDAGSSTEIVCGSKSWPCLFPQHGPGRKHLRPIALRPWQQALVDQDPRPLIRGLIHSDGCRVINRSMGSQYLRYMFDNASADIRKIFCDACDQLGVPWRQPKERTISVARREGVEMLDSFIGPKS
jgi:hypothetical protein